MAEAFAIAWQRFADYDPTRAAFSTWVFGIAINLLRRHARTEIYQLALFSRTGTDPAQASDEGAIVDRLTASEFWPKVAAELAEMDEVDRDVLTLYAWARHELHRDRRDARDTRGHGEIADEPSS